MKLAEDNKKESEEYLAKKAKESGAISILHSIALPLRHIWVSLRPWSCLSAARLP